MKNVIETATKLDDLFQFGRQVERLAMRFTGKKRIKPDDMSFSKKVLKKIIKISTLIIEHQDMTHEEDRIKESLAGNTKERLIEFREGVIKNMKGSLTLVAEFLKQYQRSLDGKMLPFAEKSVEVLLNESVKLCVVIEKEYTLQNNVELEGKNVSSK